MPADFQKVVHILPRFSPRQYHALMVSLRNAMGFEENDIAKFRLKTLNHLYSFGIKSALDAYDVKRSTVFVWKKRFEASGKKLSSLIPQSTRPHKVRSMKVDLRLNQLIKSIREEHGNVGKTKLKPFVDALARDLQVNSYGLEKIQKVVTRNHYYFETVKTRKYHKKAINRLKHAPKQERPGYLQLDSVALWLNGSIIYFMTIIDVFTKVAWCKVTRTLSSRAAKEALMEFKQTYQYPVREIQTDNGHEFLGEFTQYLESQNIPHNFIYPRSPKINGVVERFNRTLKDEFIFRCDEIYTKDWLGLSEKLSHWLIWYNTQRPHYSLHNMTPTAYLQKFIDQTV